MKSRTTETDDAIIFCQICSTYGVYPCISEELHKAIAKNFKLLEEKLKTAEEKIKKLEKCRRRGWDLAIEDVIDCIERHYHHDLSEEAKDIVREIEFIEYEFRW